MNFRQKVTLKNPVQKNCLVCGEPFFGRANKLYHRECKIKLNNKTAGSRRRREAPHRVAIRYNDLLLQVIFKYARNPKKSYTLQKLISFGFKKEVYNNIVLLRNATISFYVCYKFAWSVNPDTDKVTILREPLIRALKNREDRGEVAGSDVFLKCW